MLYCNWGFKLGFDYEYSKLCDFILKKYSLKLGGHPWIVTASIAQLLCIVNNEHQLHCMCEKCCHAFTSARVAVGLCKAADS